MSAQNESEERGRRVSTRPSLCLENMNESIFFSMANFCMSEVSTVPLVPFLPLKQGERTLTGSLDLPALKEP